MSLTFKDESGNDVDVSGITDENPIRFSFTEASVIPKNTNQTKDNNSLLRNLIENNQTVNCLWFDFSSNSWKEDGCWLDDIKGGFVYCECNHLTDFGASVGNFEFYDVI